MGTSEKGWGLRRVLGVGCCTVQHVVGLEHLYLTEGEREMKGERMHISIKREKERLGKRMRIYACNCVKRGKPESSGMYVYLHSCTRRRKKERARESKERSRERQD